MFEFKKLCDAFEEMSTVEKGVILTEKSVSILAKLRSLEIPGIDAVTALAGFIVGSVAADGKLNEQEYLLIYPALVQAFDTGFDFATVKEAFSRGRDGRKLAAEYTEEMIRIFDCLDEGLKADVITLCLCVVAIDGKVSLKEKNYIRRLCKCGA